ncbi:Transposase IS200 like protein [Planctomycetes bacterium Pan216]|uniref:Transposase IS200 like protein n=1 Tax=Kolteria novifilia TaxID=2527975 RepID=A0A518B5P2_9BACT|nr:Transposase IS200 like protein [Planctomycetes bacterium Pan216]
MLSFTSRTPLAADESFVPNSYLLITAGTFQKRPFMRLEHRKQMLLESLDFNCYKWKWRLLAYVILDNHYHLVVHAPDDDRSVVQHSLAHIIQSAHSYSAYHWRRDDPSIRSRIWWNFWDAPIGDLASLRCHINYLNANPAFHGKVRDPSTYPYSSYHLYVKQDRETLAQWEKDYPADKVDLIDNF